MLCYINVTLWVRRYIITCLCPNLVSFPFYAIPIFPFKFPKFFIYLSPGIFFLDLGTYIYTHLPPLRPIVSQTASILSPTAQFIDHILQPLARSYTDYFHNSTALSIMLQNLHVPDDAILVAIDVESLYPSMPKHNIPGNAPTSPSSHF